jgi:hypothetical protein
MKDFNLAKYLKEHNLGSHGILGNYIDLQALKEEEVGNNGNLEGTLTIDWSGGIPELKASCKNWGVECEIITMNGPGGGWPEVAIMGKVDAIKNWLKNEYTQDEEELEYFMDMIELDGVQENFSKKEMELDTKIPYEGPERKVDGFGDKFDQVNPVSELEGGYKMSENIWMQNVDGTDAYKVGNWTCYYDFPGVLVWSYGRVPFSDLAVYATPNWEGDGTTPIQIDIDEETQDQMTLKQSEFADFNEYATAMKPYLDRIEDLESDWGSLAPSEDLAELEKPENIYADDEDRLGSLGASDDRMMDLGGDQIEQGIISLLDDGFEPEDILEACKMLIDAQVNAAMQGKKY